MGTDKLNDAVKLSEEEMGAVVGGAEPDLDKQPVDGFPRDAPGQLAGIAAATSKSRPKK